MATRYEKKYCLECMSEHWLEVVRKPTGWEEICHGEEYDPRKSETHYYKWSAGGIELIEKAKSQPLPIDWQLAQKEEYIQDW